MGSRATGYELMQNGAQLRAGASFQPHLPSKLFILQVDKRARRALAIVVEIPYFFRLKHYIYSTLTNFLIQTILFKLLVINFLCRE